MDFLAELAGEEPLLELAIGTGRIALPLSERGVEVHGIDISEAMIARLREKPGGKDIPVEMADLRDFTTSRSYQTVVLVLNTIYALANQEEQIACFRRAAKALKPGGRFVVEAFVPDVTRFHRGSRAHVYDVGVGHVTIEADVHDRAQQTVLEQHVRISEQGIKLLPAFLRYIYPSEMDLMANLAGLELEHRYGGWRCEPYNAESENQISVYRAPSAS
ncbi:class I SAM-dependent DNA methyltransferase [Streptomyces sp. SS8]